MRALSEAAVRECLNVYRADHPKNWNQMPTQDDDNISIPLATRVMGEFVWRFANRADGNDLLTLLGDTDVSFDGHPTDPASWFDWLASLDWIASGNEPQSGADLTGRWWVGETRVFEIPTARREPGTHADKLSRAEAFLAMTEYLWRFANRRGANQVADVLVVLRESVSSAEPGVFWADWMESVRWVLAGNAAQSGPPLNHATFNG